MIEGCVMELFTVEELDKAGEIYAETRADEFAMRCAAEIVIPALPRINEETGERNDPMALANKVKRTLAFVMGPGGFVPSLQ